LNASQIVFNTVSDDIIPKHASFTGSVEHLSSGVQLSGELDGTFTNAATYDFDAEESAGNYIQGSISFEGTIEAPSRPTITAAVSIARSAVNTATVNANYRRTNTDGSVVYLTGSGSYDIDTETLDLTMSNQNGLVVDMSVINTLPENGEFGTIKTAGGTTLATLKTVNDIPMVEYTDHYIESIF
jgi:hypothetical protein